MGKNEKGDALKREMLVWDAKMDDYFIQSMLKQQHNGHRVDGTFTSTAYTNMVNELHDKLKMNFNKSHLKNRLKTLKDHFAQCYDLFRGVGLSGFSWNSETNLFEAEAEVWDALVTAKPDAVKWKTKKISNYNELFELFAKDMATGAAAGTSKEKKKQWSEDHPETIEEIDRLLSSNKVTYENLIIDDDVFMSTMPSLQEEQMSSNTSKNKKRKREEEEDMTVRIMASLEVVGQAIKEGNTILKESNMIMERSRQRLYTGEESYNALELMDLEPKLITRAYLFLIKNQDSAQAFFGCPSHVRRALLYDLVGDDAS